MSRTFAPRPSVLLGFFFSWSSHTTSPTLVKHSTREILLGVCSFACHTTNFSEPSWCVSCVQGADLWRLATGMAAEVKTFKFTLPYNGHGRFTPELLMRSLAVQASTCWRDFSKSYWRLFKRLLINEVFETQTTCRLSWHVSIEWCGLWSIRSELRSKFRARFAHWFIVWNCWKLP